MIRTPDFLPGTPESDDCAMDALSDVLRVVRMRGGVFLRAEFSAPWCVSSQVGPDDCRWLLNGSGHLVLFHYVVAGRLKARMPDGALTELAAGQVFMLPHNDRHVLGSDLGLPAVPTKQLMQSPPEGGLLEIRHGGGGEQTRIVCGFLGLDRLGGNPLLEALPPMLTFDTGEEGTPSWITGSLEFAANGIAGGRPGAETVLAKLSELLFVEAIRRYVDGLEADRVGWLAGLRDPFVSRALALLHGDVARPWTVDDLGREVGLSRSALADRFTRLIGETPMRYLARWRLHSAAHELRAGDAPVARVAERAGYTGFAFSRAFKREFGVAPAAWRRSRGEPAPD